MKNFGNWDIFLPNRIVYNGKECYYNKSNAVKEAYMEEKLYKTIGSTGAASLVIGICILVTGVASGVLMIVNGGRLLKSRKKILL